MLTSGIAQEQSFLTQVKSLVVSSLPDGYSHRATGKNYIA